ncbi:MAG: hypothetical protein VB071_08530 [Lawsonibacter sp.]|nr:hypothetical protein [Lawsonibacter sp.]
MMSKVDLKKAPRLRKGKEKSIQWDKPKQMPGRPETAAAGTPAATLPAVPQTAVRPTNMSATWGASSATALSNGQTSPGFFNVGQAKSYINNTDRLSAETPAAVTVDTSTGIYNNPGRVQSRTQIAVPAGLSGWQPTIGFQDLGAMENYLESGGSTAQAQLYGGYGLPSGTGGGGSALSDSGAGRGGQEQPLLSGREMDMALEILAASAPAWDLMDTGWTGQTSRNSPLASNNFDSSPTWDFMDADWTGQNKDSPELSSAWLTAPREMSLENSQDMDYYRNADSPLWQLAYEMATADTSERNRPNPAYSGNESSIYALKPTDGAGETGKDYAEKSLNQILLGNYTDDVTLLGTAGQIALGLTGLDFAADARDIIHDVTNWEWTPGHVGQTLLDAIGFIPGIGVVKNVDEVAELLKGVVKNADEVAAVLKGLLGSTSEAARVVKDVFGSTDEAASAFKRIFGNADEATEIVNPFLKTAETMSEGAGDAGRYFKDEQLKTEPNTAYFWSGNSNGIGGKDFAMDHASKNGGTTLEGLMKSQGIEMPTWDIADQSSKKAWEYASGKYAGQVSGDVHALIGATQRENSIWRTIELPRLMDNPYVSKIILVDPENLTETIIFRR